MRLLSAFFVRRYASGVKDRGGPFGDDSDLPRGGASAPGSLPAAPLRSGYGSSDAWKEAGLMTGDRVHFTPNGYRLIGDMLFDAIME